MHDQVHPDDLGGDCEGHVFVNWIFVRALVEHPSFFFLMEVKGCLRTCWTDMRVWGPISHRRPGPDNTSCWVGAWVERNQKRIKGQIENIYRTNRGQYYRTNIGHSNFNGTFTNAASRVIDRIAFL